MSKTLGVPTRMLGKVQEFGKFTVFQPFWSKLRLCPLISSLKLLNLIKVTLSISA